jgi:hypothetical protein
VSDARRRDGDVAAAPGGRRTEACRRNSKTARRLEFGRDLILREAKNMGKLTRSTWR